MQEGEKLFLSSQSFGFGPTSELLHIGKGLSQSSFFREGEMVLYNTPEAQAILGDTHSRLKITQEDDGRDVLEFLRQHGREYGFNSIFSSYDAAPIFYGWFHDIPCFLYDGMLSFWDVSSFKNSIAENLKKLKRAKREEDERGMVELYKEITKGNHHESIFLAYFLADRNFARGGDNPERQLQDFVELQRKTKIVGGIMDPNIPYDPSITRDHILVSLSASLVPTVEFEQNVQFALNTLHFICELCVSMPGIPWIISMNPKVFMALNEDGQLEDLPKNLQVRESFSVEENLKHIQNAKALFISPGFSSVHEAAYYRTPTLFLPEQNGGQPVGYTKLKKDGYPALPNLTFAENVGGCRTSNFDEFHMDELYDASDRIYKASEFEAVRTQVRRTVKKLLSSLSFACKIGQAQNEAISHIIGGFEGVREIIDGIVDCLKSRISS